MDGVEVLVIAALTDEGIWDSTERSIGSEYIGVDKNHDLSWYVSGSDYVDSTDFSYDQPPGKFGYDWGKGTTNVKDIVIGTGLVNTNKLIAMNLISNTPGWYVLWDKVEEFRLDHSDKWFVPSNEELNLIYENKSSLMNLTVTRGQTYAWYWSSSEDSIASNALPVNMINGTEGGVDKSACFTRARLCVQFDAEDIQ